MQRKSHRKIENQAEKEESPNLHTDTKVEEGQKHQEDLQRYQEGEKIPEIVFPKTISAKLTQRWECALIIKISKSKREIETIRKRLLNLWKIKGGMELKELGYDFYIVHDLLEDDRTQIIVASHWWFGASPILIRSWIPYFSVVKESTKMVTIIWVTIKFFPVEYHTPKILITLGNLLGKTVAPDARSTNQAFYVRICIDIDCWQ